MRKAHNAKTERNEEICRRRKAGETFTAIGKSLGVSKNRVREVFCREEGISVYSRDYLGWAERNSR